MRRKISIAMLTLLLAGTAFPQTKPQPQKPDDDTIRISAELVQIDVVVTDKTEKVVKGLTKDDFELFESGKKQLISFFEFVESGKSRRPADVAKQTETPVSPQGLSETEVRRIFAFVVDDLTMRFDDLVYTRQMLKNFVDKEMQSDDLVAIVRTVGGKGLLQQFTSDKELLLRTIASLALTTSPYNIYNRDQRPLVNRETLTGPTTEIPENEADLGLAGDATDIASVSDEATQYLRSYMSLGTASFVIDSMKRLPGRKSLVLISGGLPILGTPSPSTNISPTNPGQQQPGIQTSISGASISSAGTSNFIRQLADKATRASVAIHTMDIRGLSAQVPVARFSDTPGRSSLGGAVNQQFGRLPDESLFGKNNVMDEQLGLRALAEDTGGISILNRNNFDAGLSKIVGASQGYYLLAYTPTDSKFDGDFRKVEVKLKNSNGLKVYSRRGYIAREEKVSAAPATREEVLLAAIKSPLARRDIDLDVMLLYKAAPPSKGDIDIQLNVDSKKLQFEKVDDKQQTSFDVAGFVFDGFGKLRGGFSETITANLSAEEHNRVGSSGLTYSANTTLQPGIYQVRVAVRDKKSGGIGTTSRYLEVPDLSKGRLGASSLLIGAVAPATGAVAPNDAKTPAPVPITANRQISRKQDLRYAVFIYNSKLKDGKPQVRTQLSISQNGKVLHKEAEEVVQVSEKNPSHVIKIGQLGLSGVPPGRYTMTLVITDPLADKKAQTITRRMDFIVID